MPDFTVRPRGLDTSQRAILATDYMWNWWGRVVLELGFTPTIVQGAFMSRVPGGGASDSAGVHDDGGCFDLRTWDLSPQQRDRLVRVLREFGAAAWRRDERHGMDPHLHFVLGTDRPLARGAANQWDAYERGEDGLTPPHKDYEWRPTPLVTTPPEEDDMASPKDWDAADKAVVQSLIAAELDRPVDTKKGKRSIRQQVKELFQR